MYAEKFPEINTFVFRFAFRIRIPAGNLFSSAGSGAVYATANGKFASHPVKGNAGVYLFQVVSKKMRPVKFDEKAQEQKCRQKAMQYAGNFMQELYLNADVVDNRYLFF